MATDRNKHLNDVLTSHKVSKEQDLLDKHKRKRDEIFDALVAKYSGDIYSPFNSGSFAKNTAVNKKFDFDLMIPFKRNSFSTLEEMFTDLYNYLLEKYGSIAHVRKQKVSIGTEFFADDNGDVVKIDVVPGRELNQNQYKEDDKLNLYVYSQFGKLQGGSDYIRSNIKAQVQNIRDNADKVNLRQNVRLLKVWKIYNSKTPKSFFLELITIKAFDKVEITGGMWDRLKSVMEYIRDNVKTVSLPDPGNSNNEVADSMSDYEKSALSDDMKNMINRIEENSDYIKVYFPLNEKFPIEDTSSNKYDERKSGPSIPPPTRFG
ncbi:nucleotidyltransferase family protein [Mucilaginibacter arboris]|uniref:Nucleotidyltransferase n=1 Tax=Mucilaginibacter arboris TaxID=2682090 RepID=A0A7K1T0D6_9SPHI|nr:nucleotidyltransferase [Mucilaginibacter arboris]MVN22988.1 nucleotidyltransferase [Mucilaginibacter arboris]